MATEEELAAIQFVKNDPKMGPLCEALGIIAEKEFGHVLRPRSEESGWLGVGALMMLRLDPVVQMVGNTVIGWALPVERIEKLIKEKNKT